MQISQVWVVDDDRSIRWVLERALQKQQFNVTCFADANNILEKLKQQQPECLITDIRMPGIDGLELLDHVQQYYPNLPVIIMTAHSDLDSAVSAYHSGAFEYLSKPFDVEDAVELVNRACQHSLEKKQSIEDQTQTKMPEIIGQAPAMQEVFRAIGRLVRSHITVLINGESGTGKELVAHALHKHSPRANKPFIALNMAAIPKDLLESELFGHERGAFTGAQSRRAGRFEQANGGTLFLDEIGDMPAELQTRLLRVLADKEFYSVGGHMPVKVDVRIIAATHQNLEQLVAQGQFREDLFHRLNVIRIHIPPLRERSGDIALLSQYFLSQAAVELQEESKTLLPETLKFLETLQWPGNVRQLENVCRWITVMASGQRVHIKDLPPELIQQAVNTTDITTGNNDWEQSLKKWTEQQLLQGHHGLLNQALPKFETILIQTALAFTHGKRQEAAKLLGWGRNTLTRKIKELGIDKKLVSEVDS